MLAATLLVWLTGAVGVPCYSTPLTLPVLGLAHYEQPRHIDLHHRRVAPYVRASIHRQPVTYQLALAVYVVAHELGHLRHSVTEHGADRWARLNWFRVVRMLGGRDTVALMLHRLIWTAEGTRAGVVD